MRPKLLLTYALQENPIESENQVPSTPKLEEFENSVFTLKTHQMLFVLTTPEES